MTRCLMRVPVAESSCRRHRPRTPPRKGNRGCKPVTKIPERHPGNNGKKNNVKPQRLPQSPYNCRSAPSMKSGNVGADLRAGHHRISVRRQRASARLSVATNMQRQMCPSYPNALHTPNLHMSFLKHIHAHLLDPFPFDFSGQVCSSARLTIKCS